jgi:autotransporter-associated beta strand protein
MTLTNANTYVGNTRISQGNLALGANGSVNDTPWINIEGGASTFDVSARTSYTFDGKVSGGGTDAAGTTFATVSNAAKIAGNLTIGDNVGEVGSIGFIAPGASSNPLSIATAGDSVGHIYTSGDLTLAGAAAGTGPATDRMKLQLNGATSTLLALGWATGDISTFIDSLATGTPLQLDTLNGVQGNIGAHDYINVGGDLTLEGAGRISVTNLGSYAPYAGSVYNLLDWSNLAIGTFNVNGGNRYVDGTESYDLDLPALTGGLLWDTSLFQTHGVVVVIPEPSRALLLMFGLLALFYRRRRA